MKKTILITGASSGFGLMLAKNLHQQGYHVIGTSRNPEKLQATVPFKVLALDITSENSITEFTKQLFETVNQLDVLVNNAGYMLTGLAEETSTEEGKLQFETNFWGTVNVTKAILPYFRKQKFGQIITVSSMMGLISLPMHPMYAASKHALEGFFKSLRFEVSQFNIKVSMVQPMWAKTNIGTNMISADGNIAEYKNYKEQVNKYIKNGLAEGDEPSVIANQIIKVINAKNPKFRNIVGKMAGMVLFLNNYAYPQFEGAVHKSVKSAK
ncbi:SDR family oxidoreductase [Pedobacter panaciterrae]|jgi:Short-chain dehydrogenases of various substrate specificities|uniref:SDR family oxidoreductase n=1 Tax=Pedobacter panaciterrae TaxID=363849 RepID=UPI00155DC512|nr:SDR family oxidoreductase [Pedobacter panaciterrae]NQX56219.1 SDR family oxidoreductase [Pedobacter panaciterrae]